MTATFIERIDGLKVSDLDGLNNVVVSAKYHITCTHRGEHLTNMFDVALPAPDPNLFMDFDLLTQDQVLAWVKSSLGEQDLADRQAAMVAMIDQMIAAKEDKPREVLAPWNTFEGASA